jgi:hypothetical protein
MPAAKPAVRPVPPPGPRAPSAKRGSSSPATAARMMPAHRFCAAAQRSGAAARA